MYNRFQSKDGLFHAAVEDALDTFGARLDELTVGLDDAAEVFAQSFRAAARLRRREPELSKVLLHNGLALVARTAGSRHGRRDIDAAVHAGRFSVCDPELSLAIIAGSTLGQAAARPPRPRQRRSRRPGHRGPAAHVRHPRRRST